MESEGRTVAEDFLADLDELDSGSEDEEGGGEAQGSSGSGGGGGGAGISMDVEDAVGSALAAALDAAGGGVGSSRGGRLKESAAYKSVLARLAGSGELGDAAVEAAALGRLEDDPEYQLVVDSNMMAVRVGEEVTKVHKRARDIYSKKFPELETLIINPLDYARVIQRIGNQMDMTEVELQDLLPSATVMVVSVTGSTTGGKPLEEAELAEAMRECEEMLELSEARASILEFVEARMQRFAPNMSALLGSSLTAQMIGQAGGLAALCNIPSCNVQALGNNRKVLQGMSTKGSVGTNSGLVAQCDIVQGAPLDLRQRALRLVAGKVTLAARVDAAHSDTAGGTGRKFRDDIAERLVKLQQPAAAKQIKALPAPDDRPRKKRGGKRYRKMKERFAPSDMRKQANRVAFGKASGGDDNSRDLGMLGMSNGTGRVRAIAQDANKNKALKKMRKQNYGSSGTTSGLASSLAFTPVQGLELANPQANVQKPADSGSKYFSNAGGFSSVGPQSGASSSDGFALPAPAKRAKQ